VQISDHKLGRHPNVGPTLIPRAVLTRFRFSPYHFDNYGASTNWNSSQIFQFSISVSSRVPLRSITLPQTANAANRLHIFAISITPSAIPSAAWTGPELSIRSVQFSSRWEDVNEQRVQAVTITLANLLPGSFASTPNTSIQSKYEVEVTGEGVTTVTPGVVYRLVPADQVRFDVLVLNDKGTGNATVRIKDSHGNVVGTSSGWPITPLRQTWTADESALSTHEPPTWVSCFLWYGGTILIVVPVEPSKIWNIVSKRQRGSREPVTYMLALASTGVFLAFQLL